MQMLGTSLCSRLTQIRSTERVTVNDILRLILKKTWEN